MIVQLLLKTCTLRTRLVLQSCDFRAGAQNLYFAYSTCTSKLRSSSQSWKLALHVLYLHYKVVTFQPVLETCTLRALDLYFKVAILQLELVLQSCDFPARAGNLYFAYRVAIYSWSWKPVLRALDLRCKVAIFQLELEPCTSRATLVQQSRNWSWKPVLRVLD